MTVSHPSQGPGILERVLAHAETTPDHRGENDSRLFRRFVANRYSASPKFVICVSA